MADTSVSSFAFVPPHSPMRIAIRVLVVLIVLIVFAVGAACLWFHHAAYASLPQLDGTIKVAGLSAPVRVVRDVQGVPHITATSLHDLFFAQGYVTAQDRLWEMDMTRRYAAGELSEVLGQQTLKSDIMHRTLQLRRVAEDGAKRLNRRDRAYADAYSAGVNAFIDHHRDQLPIEFRVLRYSPRLWTNTDSLLIGTGMSEMLAGGAISHELGREHITRKIGAQLAADLYPSTSSRDLPPQAQAGDIGFSQPSAAQQKVENAELRRKRRIAENDVRSASSRSRHDRAAVNPQANDMGFQPLVPGSNNWVVSGAHTASGKPLLSNDMHLPHQVPGIWYEAHLKCAPQGQTPPVEHDACAKFNVAGVTLPGLPFVIVGHNQRIAWGFTNLGPTVQELYVEKFNDKGEYETPDGFRQPEVRHEIIRVKRTLGVEEVPLNVVITRHGTLVTGLFEDEKRPLALKWTLYEPEGITFPFFEVDAASNWDEFTRAFSQYGSPAQNVVYADVDGHIGYHAIGKIPLRASGNGSAPVPGTDNAHEWTGFIPFDQLPSVYDPPSGILATANGRIMPDDYPHPISNEWGPPYRTERILRVLESNPQLTPADMLALQLDVHSEFDRFCAERVVHAVDRSPKAPKRIKEAAEILRKWDGTVSTDSAAPSIISTTRRELMRILLEPKIGSDWLQYRWFESSVWIENTLLQQPDRWLPPNYSSFDEVLATALDHAVTSSAPAGDLNSWRWGALSHVSVRHPIFGLVPFLKKWAGSGICEQSGNTFTVKQVGIGFGPSERMTVDFSNFDGSTLNIVSGQSGELFSPHFMDQWSAWLHGTTFPLMFSDAAVNKAKVHELTLE